MAQIISAHREVFNNFNNYKCSSGLSHKLNDEYNKYSCRRKKERKQSYSSKQQSLNDSHTQRTPTVISQCHTISHDTIPSHLQSALRNLTTDDPVSIENRTTAAPKEKKTKTVTWSPLLVVTNSDDILSQQKQRLMAVDLDSEFITSSVVEAVRTMIPKDIDAADETILMAAKLHMSEYNCKPHAVELLTILEDNEFKQDRLILAFMNMCKSGYSCQDHEILNFSSEEGCDIDHADECDFVDGLGKESSKSSENISEERCDGRVELPNPREQVSEEKRSFVLSAMLNTEHKLLVEATKCVTCKDRPREVTFLPCGHFSLCATCSEKTNICPTCNSTALGELRTFV